MHRLRTQFASRVHYVAKAVERRGIAATYELHDRALANRRSRKLHSRQLPKLDETQRRVVDALDADGYAVLPFADLFADAGLETAVLAQGDAFVDETTRALAAEAAGASAELRRRAGKEFVVRAHSFDGVTLDAEGDAWLRACLSHRMLDVANAYLRMWAKLSYVDLWYTAPQPEGSERTASQLWHRDFDDGHLLKAFLYFVDVDEGAGPFEFVAGSQAGGRYGDAWAWAPMTTTRIPEDELTSRVPADAIKSFTAPRGTLIFCNTSGLHRGGFATTTPRALATATYCSPASLRSLSVRNYELTGGADAIADEAVRFAAS